MLSKIRARWLPSLIAIATIVIVCILIMLPRLLSAQYGLLDDGVSVIMVRSISENPVAAFNFMAKAGRFMPGHWLFQTLIFQIFGVSAKKWFFVYTLVLIFQSLGILAFFRLRGFSLWQAFSAGLLYSLSSTIIECFYTFSKAEVMLITWMIFAWVAFALFARSTVRWQRIVFLVLTFLFLVFSFLSKEVGIVVIGVFAAWAILARLFSNKTPDLLQTRQMLYLFLLSLAAGAVFVALYLSFIPVTLQSGTYTRNYSPDMNLIVQQLLVWSSFILHGFLYILPLFLLFFIPAFRRAKLARVTLEQLAWMSAWLVIYLPWKFSNEYYLLPFTVGAAILAGMLMGRGLEICFSPAERRVEKVASAVIIALSLFFLQFGVANNITKARLQLLYDRINSDMVKGVARLPENAIVLTNFPAGTEYFYELRLHLDLFRNRQDITLAPFRFQGLLDGDPREYYVLTPHFQNQLIPSVRNSLYEFGVWEWDKSLREFLNGSAEQVYTKSGEVELVDFGIQGIFAPLLQGDDLDYVRSFYERPFFEGKKLTYGWSIYRLSLDADTGFRPAVVQPDGTWLMKKTDGSTISIKLDGGSGIPVAGDVNGDGWTDPGVVRLETGSFRFDTDLDGKTETTLTVTGMQPGDLPFLGDWDGNGVDTPGFYRPETASWYFGDGVKNDAGTMKRVVYGLREYLPVIGDWNGDGRDEYGSYAVDDGKVSLALDFLPEVKSMLTFYIEPGGQPLAANWYGLGHDTLAAAGPEKWCFHPYNGSNQPANAGECLEWKTGEGTALAGRWKE